MAARAPEGPRIRVAALMLRGGKVVLVRHRAGASRYHLLPGGGVDYRETLEDALIREVREETGLHIRVGQPVLINDTIDPQGSRHVVNIAFMSVIVGGEIADKPEDPRVEAVDLVDVADLGSLDLRPPLAAAITEALTRSNSPAVYLGSLFTDVSSPDRSQSR